jgi:hypothetical protein
MACVKTDKLSEKVDKSPRIEEKFCKKNRKLSLTDVENLGSLLISTCKPKRFFLVRVWCLLNKRLALKNTSR